MVTQSPAFKTAVTDSRKLKAKPNNDELLELYGLFKTGTGEDFSKAVQPGSFAFQEKYKYNAWKKVVDAKTSPQDAQKQYVDFVTKLKGTYGFEG